MIDAFFTLAVRSTAFYAFFCAAVRSTLDEQPNRLKFYILALGSSERLNRVLKKTSRCTLSVSWWGENI